MTTTTDRRVVLGGTEVDLLDEPEALDEIAAAMTGSDRPLGVVSANLDHLHHFGTTGRHRDVLTEHGDVRWLTLLDGAPLVSRASTLTGRTWPRLAGSDVAEPLLDRAERAGASVGFLGGMPDTQALLRDRLAAERPGLAISGFWAPERDELGDDDAMRALAGRIREAGTDVLVVGLGKPRQEEWIARYGEASGAHVLLAFGAVVDFLAGRVSRAPRWVVKAHAEWAWRLALEPRRLARRYLVQGPPAYLALRRDSHLHSPAPPPDGSVVTRPLPITGGALPATASGAVVIPAHDEAAVIGRTLASLAPLTAVSGIEVIVVPNGCSDDTAAVARGFEGVHVEELDRGSKVLALNAGDAVATTWPRLYLDADIEIEPATVLAVFDALAEPGVLAARPRYVYDCVGATWPVRSYYRARSRVPAPPLRLWGAGGYAANEEGHARFETFPQVTADDSWFDAQFADPEKRVVAAAPMRVRTPRDVEGLVAILARQRRGYVELGISSHAGSRVRSLVTGIRSPRAAVDVAWYLVLSVLSRRRAATALRTDERAWERDASSRTEESA